MQLTQVNYTASCILLDNNSKTLVFSGKLKLRRTKNQEADNATVSFCPDIQDSKTVFKYELRPSKFLKLSIGINTFSANLVEFIEKKMFTGLIFIYII